jgi:hypothetical protein
MALWTPPHPGFQATLLPLARSRAWVSISGDLGRIEGHSLTVESAGGDRSRWAAEPGDALPEDFMPHLITKHAYTGLREGQLDQGGVLLWQGKSWVMRQGWDGARPVARLEVLP